MDANHLTFAEKNKLLERTSPALKARLTASVDLLLELVSQGALQDTDKAEILAVSSPAARYQELYSHLHSHPVKNFIIFCWVLHNKFGREDIITEVFGLNPATLNIPSNGGPSNEPVPTCSKPTPSVNLQPKTMDIGQRLRELFHKNLVYLAKKLDYKPIRTYLIADDIFIDENIENIDSKPTNTEKLEELFGCLERRPNMAYVKFAWALQETDQTHHLEHIGLSQEDLQQIKDICMG